jgi:hypothetical protein
LEAYLISKVPIEPTEKTCMVSKLERLERQYNESIERAKNAKAKLEKLRREQDRKERIAARKARTHALIQAGGLVEIAGLMELDKGTLLGALVAISKDASNPANEHVMNEWKTSGDAILAEREAARKRLTLTSS